MNEQITGDLTANSTVQNEAGPSPYIRPATLGELDQVHAWIMEAVTDSPFYNDTFKAFEKARLSKEYLRNLHATDPAHIMVMTDDDDPVGFMMSGPEYGTLWLYWSYLIPEKRRSTQAMSSMRAFIAYWDNGRFHKIATYTKNGNRAAEAIMKRLGFKFICTLENHIFGEDYLLYEHTLTKTSQDYDRGMVARKAWWGKRLAKRLLGFSN